LNRDERLERSLGRWLAAGVGVFFALMVTFPIYRAIEGPDRAEEAATYRGGQIWEGQKLWAANCTLCHGDQGQGVDAPALNSKQFLRAANEEQIVGIVSVGIPGTNMQSWSNEYGGPLTPEEIRAVAAFLASLEPAAPDRPDWRNFTPSPTPVPPSP
jgi:mono/diheme cytochrome c family protein